MTDRTAAFHAVAEAHAKLGSLDVVVNNAGYGLFGMIEELSEAQARAQHRGHVLQVSSIGGITAFPGLGLYHASKWALEGMSQALAGELAAFGGHVTLIEPGGFDTDWGGSSAVQAGQLEAYAPVRQRIAEMRRGMIGKRGDPAATGRAILKVVDADPPPLRVFLGEAPLGLAKADYAKRIETWEAWDAVAREAQGR